MESTILRFGHTSTKDFNDFCVCCLAVAMRTPRYVIMYVTLSVSMFPVWGVFWGEFLWAVLS